MKGAEMPSGAADLDPDLFYTVEDAITGDQYDVRGSSFREEDHTLVKDRDPSPYARPHKPRTDKAGNPAPRKAAAAVAAAGQES